MEYQAKISEEEIEGLPIFTFEGEIVVIDHEAKIDAAVKDLLSYPYIGFDTETKPAFKKGVTHQIGLLQLATDRRVYLFRLNQCGFSTNLQALLANEQVTKIGVGIRDDVRGLRKLANFTPANFLDLQIFAKAFGIEEMSFSKLMSIIFHVKISKRQRTSNWEAPQLTPAQIHYAATDAWGALKMYKALKSGKSQLQQISLSKDLPDTGIEK